jgi:hypothetical protein
MGRSKQEAANSKQRKRKPTWTRGLMAAFSILPFHLFSSSPVHLWNSVFVFGY